MRLIAVTLLAVVLTACGQPQRHETTSSVATTAPVVASFTVNELLENDGQIQGCTRSLGRAGANPGADIFREDGVDVKALGFMRIDNTLIDVALVSGESTETGSTRTFEDSTHATRIVETLKTGAAHEEADSVEESGSLTITHNGVTQAIQVVGGVAC